MRSTLVLISTLVFATVGCGDDEDPPEDSGGAKSASATLSPTVPGAAGAAGAPAAANTATGTATFTTEGAQVKAVVNISNAPPGQHGFHIHVTPDCSNGGDAAGGHWDPAGTAMHGAWGQGMHHGGDIGNITIAANGSGSTTLTTDDWSIGTGDDNDVVGHAVILHANPDDLMTQPTGAAGARIACGIIQLR
jgi:Cu-Zn family superoxide dismutase